MNDGEAIDLLYGLVSIPSVSGSERTASAFFAERLRAHGFEAGLDEVGNVRAKIRPTATPSNRAFPRLVLLGHIDTVPGEVAVRIEDDKLYGRGSVDAKGCLATFAAATARAATAGRLGAHVELIACVEEEVASSRGAHHVAATLPAPDACIVGEPSHWDRLTLGYKGFLRARIRTAQDVAHTAAESRGAAARACLAWADIEREAARHGERRDGDTPTWDRLLVHLDGVRTGSDGLREHAELDARLRLPPDLPPDAAQAWLHRMLEHAEGDFALEVVGGLAAHADARTSPLARLLARAIVREGSRATYQRKTGTADLNVVGPAWRCPILAYGPGDSALDHTPDEHLALDELRRAIRVLDGLLADAGLAELRRIESSGSAAAAQSM